MKEIDKRETLVLEKIKNISFIHFERAAKRDNKYIDSERDKIKNK